MVFLYSMIMLTVKYLVLYNRSGNIQDAKRLLTDNAYCNVIFGFVLPIAPKRSTRYRSNKRFGLLGRPQGPNTRLR
jgi:hypothetical protein